ncbi:MAG: pirin family protein [Nevskiales bacterium]
MSANVELLIKARPTELGGFTVRRALPNRECRSVGPFVFLDHMGPAAFAPGEGIDVRPHPHIGLATVTFLFEGELMHRDSLGTIQVIRPGDVNWMNAGRGIVHSERTPSELRPQGARAHGIQAWVALPLHAEESAPSFQHHAAATLPRFKEGAADLVLIAGSAYGHSALVAVSSPMFYLDVQLAAGAELSIPDEYRERACYVAEGAVLLEEQPIANGELAVLAPSGTPKLRAQAPARVMLLGGASLDAPRYLWWNFVSSSEQRIGQAKQEWQQRRFPSVPGETELIPLPADIGRPAAAKPRSG